MAPSSVLPLEKDSTRRVRTQLIRSYQRRAAGAARRTFRQAQWTELSGAYSRPSA